MIWYKKKELFFDLLIDVKVKSDDKCYCTAVETIKPLWLDDLLWDLLKMETNKETPLSLRTIGAFTVSGAELFKNETELKEWTISELEEIIDNYLEIIYVFLTIFLYLLKCPQSLILSALRAFCFCGKPHISRSIFLYFRYQAWLKSW